MKKLLLSIIFFLILIFQSFIPSWATQQEILELREQIQNLTQRVQVVRNIPAGSILPFAGVNSPDGWLICNGQIVSRNEFTSLYAVIGRTYTPINHNPPIGESLFCVPDMRGRVIVGDDSGVNATGRITSNNTLGASGGEEKHQLTVNELASHSHQLRTRAGSSASGINGYQVPITTEPFDQFYSFDAGGDQPHNNMQPYLVLNYIIKH